MPGQEQQAQPSSVIVFHLTTLGDLLFSLPLLAAIKAGWRGTRLVSAARAYLLPLLRVTGLVDDVLERPRTTWAKCRLACALRRAHFQMAVCLAMSPETSLLAWLSGAPRRIGFAGAEFGRLLNELVPFEPPPSLLNNMRMLERLRLPRVAEDYVGLIPQDSAAATRARDLLDALGVNGPYIVVAPGAGVRRRHKAWAPENFGLAAQALAQEYHWRVAIVGGGAEQEIAAATQDTCPSATSLVGRTDLLCLAELLRGARLLLGNDSGPLHLAAAVETAALGLFGPTDPAKTGPRGKHSRVLVAPDKDLSRLGPEAVVEAAKALVEEARPA